MLAEMPSSHKPPVGVLRLGQPYDNSACTSHWPIDGSMLVQLLRRWYNIDPLMVECLLFARNSATGTVKAAFFTIILFYRISLFI